MVAQIRMARQAKSDVGHDLHTHIVTHMEAHVNTTGLWEGRRFNFRILGSSVCWFHRNLLSKNYQLVTSTNDEVPHPYKKCAEVSD